VSWIKARPLAALAVLALGLRIACAVATEYKPIFPSYYYTDANLIHAGAVAALGDLAAGRPAQINGTLSEQLQIATTLQVYRAFGVRPLAIKLVNALLGALGVAALAGALSLVFPPGAGLAAGALVAVWPSHIFYTSQNLKESPADLLAYVALGAALAAASAAFKRGSAAWLLALMTCALLGAGFYRSYVLLSMSAGLLASCALAARERRLRPGALAAAGCVCAALALYPWLSQRLVLHFTRNSSGLSEKDRLRLGVIPMTYDERDSGAVSRPTSPAGITAFRKSRQLADRRWTMISTGREIGTQIHPDAEFKSWLDVLLYLPKGAFTILFMPLPGLYPMDGKIGRYAAAAENSLLLVLALLAAAGFARGEKTAPRLGLLVFFAAMTVGAALLEFDLGSAGRHKLLYLPMLFPFAAEELIRRRRL
jgi:hypothetical protein